MTEDAARRLRKSDLTDDECVEALHAFEATKTPECPGGSKSAAARNLGLDRCTFKNRLARAYSRGLTAEKLPAVWPGMEVKTRSQTFDRDGQLTSQSFKMGKETGPEAVVPPDYLLERATLQTDGEGNLTQQWLKLRKDAGQIMTAIDAIRQVVGEIPIPARDIVYPEVTSDERLCNLHPLPDMHLGLFAWGRETKGPSWDLKTAIRKYRETMIRVMSRSPAAACGVILGGGDLLHADNSQNRTLKSGNILDVDTRYSKVLAQACELLVFQIELARAKYPKVLVRILPGNHDEHSAIAVTWFLHAWYREDERVEIDTDPSEFWFHRFGKVMLAANHGHNAKLSDLPKIMATRQSRMWGQSDFRYGHGFHIHHRTGHIFEDGGAICESHQSPSAADAYHASHGYVAGRTMCSITYDRDWGEIGRSTEALR
jgi:hypothetical protein